MSLCRSLNPLSPKSQVGFTIWLCRLVIVLNGDNKALEVCCWGSKLIPHVLADAGCFLAFKCKTPVGQDWKRCSDNAGKFSCNCSGRWVGRGRSFPFLPILGDRACHNSAQQTRAACQCLICWRLRNYSILTIPCQSRKYLWTLGDVKFRSSLRFHGVWKPKLYQGKKRTDDLRGIMFIIYLETMDWLNFSCLWTLG